MATRLLTSENPERGYINGAEELILSQTIQFHIRRWGRTIVEDSICLVVQAELMYLRVTRYMTTGGLDRVPLFTWILSLVLRLLCGITTSTIQKDRAWVLSSLLGLYFITIFSWILDWLGGEYVILEVLKLKLGMT